VLGDVGLNSVTTALEKTRQLLLSSRNENGFWTGELSASALSTATAISALSFYLQKEGRNHDRRNLDQMISSGLKWLIHQQNEDGGWGDTTASYSNISTTMLVVAAFHASEREKEHVQLLDRAMHYIDAVGGIEAIRQRYGEDKTFAVPILANCAMAGIVDWGEVAALPFEAACVPQKFYHLLQLPVVSYAIPALVAIGQVKFANDPPVNPLVRWIRNFARTGSLRVLQRMQPESGGFLEAVPLTSFVCMGLLNSGCRDHPVVENGTRFLVESFRDEGQGTGTWPIDTNLATWVTTLSINALCTDPGYEINELDPALLRWLLDCQYKTIHPFTGAAPGGWGWSDLSGAVPDADDTPGALLALKNYRKRVALDDSIVSQIDTAAENGVQWLLGLQNRDGGWPTFCRGWGRLPFDRSGTDITAHVIRALVAWKSESKKRDSIESAVRRGFEYLSNSQRPDGSWLPLWFGNQDQVGDINPFYGTARVLLAYYHAERFDTHPAKNGLEWLRRNQNVDGGWGGGPSICLNAEQLTVSSVEETAVCTEALLLDNHPESVSAARRGLDWLVTAVADDAVEYCSPIGFYFAKLWYFEQLYPLIFATSALGTALRCCNTPMQSSGETP
jgi:squalene-hopene/tetraprenyl-beta-curcumene cyclase